MAVGLRTMKMDDGNFKDAANDYFLLLNRGYAPKPALKLVGDRRRLSGLQRKVLFRGICPEEKIAGRKEKLLSDFSQLKNKKFHIDGYNVLFTVMNFLLGKEVFIANDGVIRDVGDYAGIEQPQVFNRAIEAVTSCIGSLETASATVYLDAPVPGSSLHAHAISRAMQDFGVSGSVQPVSQQPVDEVLKIIPLADDVMATSDSEIMDAATCKLADLSRFVLENQYNAGFMNLECVLQSRGRP